MHTAGVLLLGATAICLPIWIVFSSSPALPRAAASAAARCPSPAAASRADAALSAAKRRYLTESRGTVIQADLRRIAGDGALLGALGAGKLKSALARADRQLVRHVVQIRVLRGPRVLVDANPTSFDVAGSELDLQGVGARSLGRLQITVQDVIGFIKLVRKLDAAEVVVRGAGGQLRSSLPAAAALSLPRSGCVRVGARRYVVRSFNEPSFSGEPLTIWVLTR